MQVLVDRGRNKWTQNQELFFCFFHSKNVFDHALPPIRICDLSPAFSPVSCRWYTHHSVSLFSFLISFPYFAVTALLIIISGFSVWFFSFFTSLDFSAFVVMDQRDFSYPCLGIWAFKSFSSSYSLVMAADASVNAYLPLLFVNALLNSSSEYPQSTQTHKRVANVFCRSRLHKAISDEQSCIGLRCLFKFPCCD